MPCKCLFSLTGIIVLLLGRHLSRSEYASSLFFSLALNCDQPLPIVTSEEIGKTPLTSAALCLASQSHPRCMGITCNSTGCQKIQKPTIGPIHCIKKHDDPEQKDFLMSNFAQHSPEFALLDVSNGKIEPIDVKGVSPVVFPNMSATTLQTQMGSDILACSNDPKECQLWSERSNQWNTFPSLISSHSGGTLSLVGSKLIVIGGALNDSHVHGIVEIYEPATSQWILGPSIVPNRKEHTSLALNDTFLMVIGGYQVDSIIDSVKILDVHSMKWSDLDSYPIPIYGTSCGMINSTYVLCIGGRKPWTMVTMANGLDLSTSFGTWERNAIYDLTTPVFEGFIHASGDSLFFITIFSSGFKRTPWLRRMNLTEESPKWELLPLPSGLNFIHVSPFIFDGYKIEP